MWWMFALSFAGMFATVIARSFIDHDEYEIPQADVEQAMANAGQNPAMGGVK